MSPIAILYTATVIVSVIIALLLADLARRTGNAKIAAEKKRKEEDEARRRAESGDQEIKAEVFSEIAHLVESRRLRNELAETVASVFTRKLAQKIKAAGEELSRKFEAVIRDKEQNEEIAWKKYTKVLRDQRQTEAVVRSIAEGLVVLDAQGRVVMINPAAERLLGVSREEKLGKPISSDIKDEQLIALVKGAPGAEDKEIELLSPKDDTKKILRASTAVIENEGGETIGMVSVLSDITKQKELDQMKSTFVANVSHELRTPLIAIQKSVALILSKAPGQLTRAQEEFLSMADRNLKRLSLLINDLLDLSKIEAGKMELRKEVSPIAKVIADAAGSLGTWAQAKEITIEQHILGDMPDVLMDSNRIIQVLNNLVGNAIKFTPHNGTIIVRASFHKEKKEIEVSVQDSGIGIPPEVLPKMFSKFYQVGERVSTDIAGTGIGLSISKEIIKLHGGNIWVESEKRRGAKFIFTLPL